MFGDPQRVIIAGRKAGVKTVGITTGNYSMQELCDAGADFAFKDLTNPDLFLTALKSPNH